MALKDIAAERTGACTRRTVEAVDRGGAVVYDITQDVQQL
jgi:hypothetical protein